MNKQITETSALVKFMLRAFPQCNVPDEKERTIAFEMGLVALEALGRFSLEGQDVPRLAAVASAWSVDGFRPTGSRVRALMRRVYGKPKPGAKRCYEVLGVRVAEGGETSSGVGPVAATAYSNKLHQLRRG